MQLLSINTVLLFYYIANTLGRNSKIISTPLIFNNMTKEELTRKLEIYKNHETLLIKYVELINIDNDLFDYIRYSLKNLTITYCNVKSIKKQSFENFERLTYLFINNNNLKIFNGSILAPIPNLENLDLSNNNIQQFNVTYNSYTLKTLVLNNNNLTSLRKNNFYIKCQYLKTLIIKNCRISYIEPGILHHLSKLLFLDMQNNFLEFIESNAFLGLTKLNHLVLHNSTIENIKYNAFNGLVQLKKLNLQNNLISQILEHYFTELTKLQELELSFNMMEVLNESNFVNLPSLLKLKLNNNQIKEIPCRVFNKISTLTELDLSNNELSDIAICAFESLNQLTNLHLQQNNLTHLRIGTFSRLRSLVQLDLSFNKLNSLEETIIHPLENVQIININGNEFEYLDPVSLLENLESLHQIDLSENKWDCSNLTLLIKYLKARNINYECKILNYYNENIAGIQCYHKEKYFDSKVQNEKLDFNKGIFVEKYLIQKIIDGLENLNNVTNKIEKNVQQFSTNFTRNYFHSKVTKIANDDFQENLNNSEIGKLINPMNDEIETTPNLNVIIKSLEKLNYRIYIFVIAFIIFLCFVICCCSLHFFKFTHICDNAN